MLKHVLLHGHLLSYKWALNVCKASIQSFQNKAFKYEIPLRLNHHTCARGGHAASFSYSLQPSSPFPYQSRCHFRFPIWFFSSAILFLHTQNGYFVLLEEWVLQLISCVSCTKPWIHLQALLWLKTLAFGRCSDMYTEAHSDGHVSLVWDQAVIPNFPAHRFAVQC